ncbi:MAG: smalltalk protein [Prevotella sp.]|nr:smalltalk protein [Candidatus Equicola faecalis]MDO4819310.1 smalltalk protein [Prevotella sp.]
MNKEVIKTILQFAVSVLTALLTALGTTSCYNHLIGV